MNSQEILSELRRLEGVAQSLRWEQTLLALRECQSIVNDDLPSATLTLFKGVMKYVTDYLRTQGKAVTDQRLANTIRLFKAALEENKVLTELAAEQLRGGALLNDERARQKEAWLNDMNATFDRLREQAISLEDLEIINQRHRELLRNVYDMKSEDRPSQEDNFHSYQSSFPATAQEAAEQVNGFLRDLADPQKDPNDVLTAFMGSVCMMFIQFLGQMLKPVVGEAQATELVEGATAVYQRYMHDMTGEESRARYGMGEPSKIYAPAFRHQQQPACVPSSSSSKLEEKEEAHHRYG